jgi:hypothetical protein
MIPERGQKFLSCTFSLETSLWHGDRCSCHHCALRLWCMYAFTVVTRNVSLSLMLWISSFILGHWHENTSLMSVPCIAWLGIIDQHSALIIIPLFITPATTGFGTYVPSSGSVLYPCELLESPKWLCHRDGYPWNANVGGLCAPDFVVSCVTLSSWALIAVCAQLDKVTCHFF